MSSHHSKFLLPLIGCLLLPHPAFADNIFNIVNYNSDQNGWILSGTIDVSAVGNIATVQSVDVTLSNGSTSYTLDVLAGVSDLSIQGNFLEVPQGGFVNFTAGPYPSAAYQAFNTAGFADYIGGIANGANLGWSQFYWDLFPTPYNDAGAQPSVLGDHIGSDPMIIGTAQASTVPEPSSLVILGSALPLVAGLVYRRRRQCLATSANGFGN